MTATSGYYIGLMSGTSADAIDAALVNFDGNDYRLVALESGNYEPQLQHAIKQLMQTGTIDLDALGQIDIGIAAAFANTVNSLLKKHNIEPNRIIAIGSHGQTIRHLPPAPDGLKPGFSLQLGDPNTIAAHTHIDVIADFRRADMAHGGHGAPLAPAFHQFVFNESNPATAKFGVLNLGGIANITVFNNSEITAWDTGPASTLMDAWINQHQAKPYDDKGLWAASGVVNQPLLKHLLQHPYFKLSPPKSTGFESFNLQWLNQMLDAAATNISAEDVQATLLELSVQAIIDGIKHLALARIFVCGGGVYNTYLLERLRCGLPATVIESSEAKGVNPQAMEAMAFAWLAWRHAQGLSGNIPSVTGAKQAVVLGGFFPKPR